MAGGEAGEQSTTLEDTPTWVVAFVCSVIVLISLFVERTLRYTGKSLRRKNQKSLYEALQKIKEELMLLGFISLLLTVSQNTVSKICIPIESAHKWLPCKNEDAFDTTHHFHISFFSIGRRVLAEASFVDDHCSKKGKVQLLSIEVLHHLHIFIFVLAVVHVSMCALTILFRGAKEDRENRKTLIKMQLRYEGWEIIKKISKMPKLIPKLIRQWQQWEDTIQNEKFDPEEVLRKKFTHIQYHASIRGRFLGMGKNITLLSWLHSFFKQFYDSVTKSDYTTLRLGFIMTHCRGNPKFNFYKYTVRALEADFKKVVGISWYLWLFVVFFLLVNISGLHAYFWIAFLPFIVSSCLY